MITVVGTIAMLWVGGHILLQASYDLGWHLPYDLVHKLESPVAEIPAIGGALAWLINTMCSAILGILWGSGVMVLVQAVRRVLPFGKKKSTSH